MGTLNGFTLTGARMPYAMAERKVLPFSDWIGHLRKRSQTPVNAQILIMVLTILYIFSGTFDSLTDIAMSATWIFYIITLYGVFKLRKRKTDRPCSMPLYPIPPIIALVLGAYVVMNFAIVSFNTAIFAVILTLIGIPVYYLTQKYGKNQEPN